MKEIMNVSAFYPGDVAFTELTILAKVASKH